MKNFSWGIAAALVVALLVGAAIGAVVEHERITSESSSAQDAPPAISTADARAEATAWFGANQGAACPPLQRWWASAAAVYVALAQGRANWVVARPTLIKEHTDSTATLRALRAVASPAGQADLAGLIAHEDELRAAADAATTAGAYESSVQSKVTPQTARTTTILTEAVQACGAQ